MIKCLLVLFALLALAFASQDPDGFLVPFVSRDDSRLRHASLRFHASADGLSFFLNDAPIRFGFTDLELLAPVLTGEEPAAAEQQAKVAIKVFLGARKVLLPDGAEVDGVVMHSKVREIAGAVEATEYEPLQQVFHLNERGAVASVQGAKILGGVHQPRSFSEDQQDGASQPNPEDSESINSWEEIWANIRVLHLRFLIWFHGLPVYQRVLFCLAIVMFCLLVGASAVLCALRGCCCRRCAGKGEIAPGKEGDSEFKEDASFTSLEFTAVDLAMAPANEKVPLKPLGSDEMV